MITTLLASNQAFQTNSTGWLVGIFSSTSPTIIIMSFLGIFAIRWKYKWVFFMYVCGMLASLALLAVAAFGCFSLVVGLTISTQTVSTDEVACQLNLYSCCCCDSTTVAVRCPEWNHGEVIVIIATDLKLSGVTSLLCTFYIFVALMSGWPLWKNIRDHKIIQV